MGLIQGFIQGSIQSWFASVGIHWGGFIVVFVAVVGWLVSETTPTVGASGSFTPWFYHVNFGPGLARFYLR